MQSLLHADYERVEIADREVPEIAPDEVLLRVAACGVCGSELEAFKTRSARRTPPLILGHEFCGVIDQLGADVRGLEIGRRVVSNSLVPCGECVRCKHGDTFLCDKRQIFGMNRGGAAAQWVNVPARSLLHWPDNLPAEAACLAEPLANGVHVANLLRPFQPQTVLVIGAGPIGLFCQQAISAMLGARVWAADLSDARLEVAKRLGAVEAWNPRQVDIVQLIKEVTDGEGADAVVDAVGAARSKAQSLEATRPGGVAIWIGLHENHVALDTYGVTLPQKHVIGSYASTQDEMQHAIDLMASGQVDATSWTHPFPLSEGATAFHRMLAAQNDDIKAVLLP